MKHLVLVIATSSMLVKCNVDGINNLIDIPGSEIKLPPYSGSEIGQIIQQDTNFLKTPDKVVPKLNVDADRNENKVFSFKYICGLGKLYHKAITEHATHPKIFIHLFSVN